MTAPPVHSRRGVMAAAFAAGLAWLGGRAAFFADRRGSGRAITASRALADVCAGLSLCPAIGEACLQALPGMASKELLARSILDGMAPTGKTVASARTLADQIRQRSQSDFRSGRTITVDGWIFSATETRLYALARLLAQT